MAFALLSVLFVRLAVEQLRNGFLAGLGRAGRPITVISMFKGHEIGRISSVGSFYGSKDEEANKKGFRQRSSMALNVGVAVKLRCKRS